MSRSPGLLLLLCRTGKIHLHSSLVSSPPRQTEMRNIHDISNNRSLGPGSQATPLRRAIQGLMPEKEADYRWQIEKNLSIPHAFPLIDYLFKKQASPTFVLPAIVDRLAFSGMVRLLVIPLNLARQYLELGSRIGPPAAKQSRTDPMRPGQGRRWRGGRRGTGTGTGTGTGNGGPARLWWSRASFCTERGEVAKSLPEIAGSADLPGKYAVPYYWDYTSYRGSRGRADSP